MDITSNQIATNMVGRRIRFLESTDPDVVPNLENPNFICGCVNTVYLTSVYGGNTVIMFLVEFDNTNQIYPVQASQCFICD